MLARTALYVLIAAAVPLVNAGQAASSLSGTIADGSTVVAGAIVTVSSPGFVKSATTDGSGRFVIPSIPPGRYDFRTTAHGYAVFERPVTVRSDNSRRNRIEVKQLVPASRQSVSVLELAARKQARTRVHRAPAIRAGV